MDAAEAKCTRPPHRLFFRASAAKLPYMSNNRIVGDAALAGWRFAALTLLGIVASLPQAVRTEAQTMMTLTSSAFSHNGAIPRKHTCDGEDISPALAWSAVPAAAKSLVLIIDDPDAPDPAAPKMTWVHWVLYDIPAPVTALPEGVGPRALPGGTREGLNDWKRTGYGGPCPPIGRHRYFHKLYALDVVLPDLGHVTKARLEQAMQGHILAQAELVGTYQR
jgi:Raf kinase inhibitor-like YbhB/YbcL family protein